ncbi:hypothetical protein M422DRAFT_29138 [Sphaerobolus stellatus SS14]|uniref:Unplaced genomic scaffold SPHSTscaffold_31, whole genome shotgun sequence n=1 Tax=Sphaerobolus stellatus (strain SS14) TaxID=990650 RepID=A0A0C9W3H1_SPHS4|nr:hypothetical protein M422DRAFT_29138 [Sphaerobolus stellatus SS14]
MPGSATHKANPDQALYGTYNDTVPEENGIQFTDQAAENYINWNYQNIPCSSVVDGNYLPPYTLPHTK